LRKHRSGPPVDCALQRKSLAQIVKPRDPVLSCKKVDPAVPGYKLRQALTYVFGSSRQVTLSADQP